MTETLARIEFQAEEWWNGNAHLCRVIASMALQHREIGSSYPAELEEIEWYIILTEIGEPLMAYADGIDNLEGYEERRKAAKTSLELFASWFDHFTD